MQAQAFPDPEPEPHPDGSAGSAASATAVDPLLGAMVQMARAFAQPPPFSAFGGPPPEVRRGSNPWSQEESASSSVQAEPRASVALPAEEGEEVIQGLSNALAEQFGAAVSDLVEDGSGSGAVGNQAGPVLWAVLSTPGRSTTASSDQCSARSAAGVSKTEM